MSLLSSPRDDWQELRRGWSWETCETKWVIFGGHWTKAGRRASAVVYQFIARLRLANDIQMIQMISGTHKNMIENEETCSQATSKPSWTPFVLNSFCTFWCKKTTFVHSVAADALDFFGMSHGTSPVNANAWEFMLWGGDRFTLFGDLSQRFCIAQPFQFEGWLHTPLVSSCLFLCWKILWTC